jgi:hypothetical protein
MVYAAEFSGLFRLFPDSFRQQIGNSPLRFRRVAKSVPNGQTSWWKSIRGPIPRGIPDDAHSMTVSGLTTTRAERQRHRSMSFTRIRFDL